MNLDIFKKDLIKYLKDRGDWVFSDEILIDELIFSIQLLKKTQKDVVKEGYRVDVSRKPGKLPYYQINTAVIGNQMAQKRIDVLYTKLSLSPQDRFKMKIEVAEKADELDKIING